MLAARAPESQVEREKEGLGERTLSMVVSREVRLLPRVEMVVFVALDEVYIEMRERYFSSKELLNTCRVRSIMSF